MIYLVLILVGLALGSFINAYVWRFYKKHTSEDKNKKKRYSITTGRSMCTHCETALAPKDLIPAVSWMLLRGKCRYCREPIEDTPLPELLTPFLFVFSYYLWPFELMGTSGSSVFILWLLILVSLVILFVYDLRWMILPNKIVATFTVIATVFTVAVAIMLGEVSYLLDSVLAGGFLSLSFYALFVFSKGAWVGGGDVKLLFGLGLISGSVLNGLLLLFIASLVGSLLALPKVLFKKMSVKQQIPFGPLLIAGCLTVFFMRSIFDVWEYMGTIILISF